MENSKTILVTEDDPLNVKLFTDVLEFSGFKVLKASDGEAALAILEWTVPALIILDIRLPGIDGFEVFRKIRTDKKFDAVKIVALTGQAREEERENIKKAGFSDLIIKPIDVKNFVEKIKKIIADGDI